MLEGYGIGYLCKKCDVIFDKSDITHKEFNDGWVKPICPYCDDILIMTWVEIQFTDEGKIIIKEEE